MDPSLPYCGTPPPPGELLSRFNLDPVLIAALLTLAAAHLALAWRRIDAPRIRLYATAGWLMAAIALVSPLCALSVALFSARVGQHMVLLLLSAPLIALALAPPAPRFERPELWLSALAFFVALWFWHMPAPYEATFTSPVIYWLMHVSLFGCGLLLWRCLLHHTSAATADALLVALFTSVQMGLLGAILSLAANPLFYPHLLTTFIWHLSPIEDQALGGVFMWVPGIALFLWASVRSLHRLWLVLEQSRPA